MVGTLVQTSNWHGVAWHDISWKQCVSIMFLKWINCEILQFVFLDLSDTPQCYRKAAYLLSNEAGHCLKENPPRLARFFPTKMWMERSYMDHRAATSLQVNLIVGSPFPESSRGLENRPAKFYWYVNGKIMLVKTDFLGLVYIFAWGVWDPCFQRTRGIGVGASLHNQTMLGRRTLIWSSPTPHDLAEPQKHCHLFSEYLQKATPGIGSPGAHLGHSDPSRSPKRQHIV